MLEVYLAGSARGERAASVSSLLISYRIPEEGFVVFKANLTVSIWNVSDGTRSHAINISLN